MPPTVLFVGVVCRRKGTLELARAARLLRERGLTDWRLVVVGGQGPTPEPEYAEIVAEFAAAGLADSLVGPEHGDQVRARLRDADIFVLPSFLEGQPIAIIEAMAAGVPVVATTVGAIPDLVRDGVEGRVVEPGDVDGPGRRAGRADRATRRCARGWATAVRRAGRGRAQPAASCRAQLAGLYASVLAGSDGDLGADAEAVPAGRDRFVDRERRDEPSRGVTRAAVRARSIVVGARGRPPAGRGGAFYAFSQQRTWVAESMVVVLPAAELDEATSASYYETLSRGQIVATFAEVAGTQRFEQRGRGPAGASRRPNGALVSTEVTVVPNTAVILIRVDGRVSRGRAADVAASPPRWPWPTSTG